MHGDLTRKSRWAWSRGLSFLAAFALVAAAVVARAEGPGDGPKAETAEFRSGDKAIKVESYLPPGEGKHPALVLLHGVDALDDRSAGLYRGLAKEYAGRGYVVLIPLYYGRTGTGGEDVKEYRALFAEYFTRGAGGPKEAARRKELFAAWGEVVRDAVAHARTLPRVDGDRMALIGISLGGSVALSAAAEHDLKLAALVECFGALPRELHGLVRRAMPPTLVIHGDADRLVPVEQAYLLAGLLLSRKAPVEVEVYPGADHMFLKGGKDLQEWPALQAKVRTDAFLEKRLKREGNSAVKGK